MDLSLYGEKFIFREGEHFLWTFQKELVLFDISSTGFLQRKFSFVGLFTKFSNNKPLNVFIKDYRI